ncbi:MAG TPA: hypothetical protein GX393_00360 [Firmicutes bacterium]|nr:hypothetical protein [Bacillota bacterium]
MTNYWLPFVVIWMPIILAALGVILVITLRWFSYRERMAILARGGAPEIVKSPEEKSKSLLASGLIVGLVGLAITIALLTVGIGMWLLFGLLPLFIGLALVLAALVLRPAKAKEEKPARAPKAEKTAETWTQEAVVVKDEEPEEEAGEETEETEEVLEPENDAENSVPF